MSSDSLKHKNSRLEHLRIELGNIVNSFSVKYKCINCFRLDIPSSNVYKFKSFKYDKLNEGSDIEKIKFFEKFFPEKARSEKVFTR